MRPHLLSGGNPGSRHALGRAARRAPRIGPRDRRPRPGRRALRGRLHRRRNRGQQPRRLRPLIVETATPTPPATSFAARSNTPAVAGPIDALKGLGRRGHNPAGRSRRPREPTNNSRCDPPRDPIRRSFARPQRDRRDPAGRRTGGPREASQRPGPHRRLAGDRPDSAEFPVARRRHPGRRCPQDARPRRGVGVLLVRKDILLAPLLVGRAVKKVADAPARPPSRWPSGWPSRSIVGTSKPTPGSPAIEPSAIAWSV